VGVLDFSWLRVACQTLKGIDFEPLYVSRRLSGFSFVGLVGTTAQTVS